MKQLSAKNRESLKNKMAEVFSDKTDTLPSEMQHILFDDLVTAFESRLEALSRAQSLPCIMDLGMKVSYEKIKA